MFHKNSYLAIAPFLFILVGVFCEVAVVRGVCILCAFRGTLFFLRVQMYTFSSTFIIRFKPLCDTLLLCQGYCWIGKNTNKKFSCVMMFIMRPSSTLKLQFVFGFNECLVATLSSFQNFWFYIWVVVVWLLILWHKWLHLLPHTYEKNPNIFQNVEKDLWNEV